MIVSAKIIGFDVPYKDYKTRFPRGSRDFVMSRGELCEFSECPAKYLAGGEDNEETEATLWGTAIDVLGPHPERFDELYAVAPATYENDKGQVKPWNWNALVCQAWRDEQGEKTVIKSDLKAKLDASLNALRASEIQPLIDCSKTQVHVLGQWHDKATDLAIPVQCLIDLVPDKNHIIFGKWLCNFKTARCGDPNTFARVIDDNWYDAGAALDMGLYCAATSEDRCEYVLPLQENVKPFHVTSPMPALSAEFLAFGRAKYEIALREYARCLETGIWPSYSTGNRLVIGPTQIIGPDQLWKYRETGGTVASRQDYQPESPVRTPEDENAGITP